MNYNSRSREQTAKWLRIVREKRSDMSISKVQRKTLTKEEHRKRIEREVKRKFRDDE